jgi:hypothetical protein
MKLRNRRSAQWERYIQRLEKHGPDTVTDFQGWRRWADKDTIKVWRLFRRNGSISMCSGFGGTRTQL